jgi:hypothetical protein
MQNRSFTLMKALLIAGLTIALYTPTSALAWSQAGGQRGGRGAAPEASGSAAATGPVDVNGKKFDPHDLSGIYTRTGGDTGFGPAKDMPPLTPAGEAKLKSVTIVGTTSRSPLVKTTTNPRQSNDLALTCNPKGFPRLLLDNYHSYHEVVMLPNRMLQLWQEEQRPRVIWLDGRPVPSPEVIDDLGPMWYGHSVGVWQGDTLVVTTLGFDDRGWLDSYGFPRSFNAKIEERYKLTDPNTLTLTLTLTDPDYYTKPWVSDVKTWKKVPRAQITKAGWYGIYGQGESICAPMDEKPFVKGAN